MPPLSSDKQLLLIGASRGLGFALAEEYLKRGWHVMATERVRTTSKLHNLLRASDGRLEIETVDIVHPDQFAALRARLSIEESIPNPANTIDAQTGKAGLLYLDYLGRQAAPS
jgi:NAD(P)-dependent dehydrogenase (short-subunit alcohol dehydrogenase family)